MTSPTTLPRWRDPPHATMRGSLVVESSSTKSSSKCSADDDDSNMTSEKSSVWDSNSFPHRSSTTFNAVGTKNSHTMDNLMNVATVNSQGSGGKVDVHIGKQIIAFFNLDTTNDRQSRKVLLTDSTDGWMTTTPNDTTNKKRRQEEDGRAKTNRPKKNRMAKNYREKIRSAQIANQIRDLHEILLKAGIKIPRSTKGMILSEAATYIRILQQQKQNHHQLLQAEPSDASIEASTTALRGVVDPGYVKRTVWQHNYKLVKTWKSLLVRLTSAHTCCVSFFHKCRTVFETVT
jgi:Helix-loop-helix DNA-binding domain